VLVNMLMKLTQGVHTTWRAFFAWIFFVTGNVNVNVVNAKTKLIKFFQCSFNTINLKLKPFRESPFIVSFYLRLNICYYHQITITLTCREPALVSISSTFYVRIFRTNIVSAAFSSYVLAMAKNSYKKCVHIMLMKLTISVS